jgi:hypothetical protein
MSLLATALPEHSNDGYVAAAYIVFFAIVLIYVAIMAVRLGRVERKLEDLRQDGAGRGDAHDGDRIGGASGATAGDGGHPQGTPREREKV